LTSPWQLPKALSKNDGSVSLGALLRRGSPYAPAVNNSPQRN
jgi:hypothetical protein